MRRAAILSGAGVIIGLACMPTEPCACSPPPPPGDVAVVFGSLRTAGGQPVARAAVSIDVGRSQQCDFAGARRGVNTTGTTAAGTYNLRVYTDQSGEQCVRAVGWAGSAGTTDSVRSAPVMLRFVPPSVQPDSIRIDLVLGS